MGASMAVAELKTYECDSEDLETGRQRANAPAHDIGGIAPMQPTGYCECGCGRKTNVATRSATRNGYVRGQPMRYVRGHRRSRLKVSLDERIAKCTITEDRSFATECVIWVGRLNDNGYGVTQCEGKIVYAHRANYERAHGPIPEGMQIDHLCRNPACVNPEHLEVVTPAENVRRSTRAKLTMAEAERIRELAGTISQKELAKRFSIDDSVISRIVNHKAWV
jgi:hypothetical protein